MNYFFSYFVHRTYCKYRGWSNSLARNSRFLPVCLYKALIVGLPLYLLLMGIHVYADVNPDDSWQTVGVNKTFDNKSFDYQIKFHSRHNGYKVYLLKYPSPVKTPLEQNNTIPAEYYLPGDCPDFRLSENDTFGDYPDFHLNENGTVPCLDVPPLSVCTSSTATTF